MKAPIYGPFGKHLMTIVDGALSMYHVNFDPHPPSAAVSSTTSPVTEVFTSYLPSHDAEFEKNCGKLVDAIKERAEGYGGGTSSGWVIEDVEHESFGEGKKGKAFVVVIGWKSVQGHIDFRETDAFKENAGFIKGLAAEMHHTVFTER